MTSQRGVSVRSDEPDFRPNTELRERVYRRAAHLRRRRQIARGLVSLGVLVVALATLTLVSRPQEQSVRAVAPGLEPRTGRPATQVPWPAPASGSDRLAIRDVNTDESRRVWLLAQVAGDVPREPIRLRENGREVVDVNVVKAPLQGQIVFVVDASASMRVDDKAARVNAALTRVIDNRFHGRVALVTFSGEASVQWVFGQEQLPVAFEQREHGDGSALADGLTTGLQVAAEDRKGLQSNVVLITDGKDTASVSNLDQVRAKARALGAAVFPIGMTGAELDPGPLEQLARDTDGLYQSGSPAQLDDMLTKVETALVQQYVVSYRSKTSNGTLDIEASWGGLSDEERDIPLAAVTRDVPVPVEVEVDEPSSWGPFEHPAARWVIAVLVVSAGGLWIYGLLELIGRRRRARSPVGRLQRGTVEGI